MQTLTLYPYDRALINKLQSRKDNEIYLGFCNAAQGGFTVDLPRVAEVPDCMFVFIKDSGNGSVTLQSTYEGLDGASTKVLSVADQCVVLVADATEWRVLTDSNFDSAPLDEYPDNAAALAAGLSVNDRYRSGDFVCVVH